MEKTDISRPKLSEFKRNTVDTMVMSKKVPLSFTSKSSTAVNRLSVASDIVAKK